MDRNEMVGMMVDLLLNGVEWHDITEETKEDEPNVVEVRACGLQGKQTVHVFTLARYDDGEVVLCHRAGEKEWERVTNNSDLLEPLFEAPFKEEVLDGEVGDEYTCSSCQGVFQRTREDKEAVAEALRKFGCREEELQIVCDDCNTEIFNKRLREVALRGVGWGPAEGPISFHREGNGWRVGNGVCVAPWEGKEVPEDAGQALTDIEINCGLVRIDENGNMEYQG